MPRGIAALLVSAAALVAPDQARRDTTAPTTGTGSISGRVLAASTGDPLRKAIVTASSSAGNFPPAVADAEGRFVVPGLPAGRFTLTASKAGYVRTTALNPAPTPQGIDVADGARLEGVEIRLPKGAVISGGVQDDRGEPAVDAIVYVEAAGQAGAGGNRVTVASVPTDDLGEYRIGSLPAGVYVVSVNAVGMPGALSSVGDFVVFGRARGGGGGVASFSTSGDRGRVYYPAAQTFADAQPITLQAGDERTSVNFTVASAPLPRTAVPPPPIASRDPNRTDSCAILGRIVQLPDGRPLARASVRAIPVQAPNAQHVAVTDDDGRYELRQLRPGGYRIFASRPGFVRLELGQRRPGERGEPIWLDPSETRSHVDVALPRHGAIAGRLVDEAGEPVEGARVRALQIRYVGGRRRLVEVDGSFPRRTDDAGRYRIYGLQPGEYVVSAVVGQIDMQQPMADVPGYAPSYYPGTPNPGEAQMVAVGLGEAVANLEFPIAAVRTARIAGKAVSADGDPITGGILLAASERSGSVAPLSAGARIDPDGSFEFPNVAPGEYVVQVFKGPSQPWAEGEFAAQFVTVNETDVTGLNLRTSAGSTISGSIRVDPPGRLVVHNAGFGVTTVAVDPDLAQPTGRAVAEVHDDSTFGLAGIHGLRRLRAAPLPPGFVLKAILANGVDITDTPLMFGSNDQSLRDVEVVVTTDATEVSGSVTDRRGRSIGDYTVVAFAADRALWYPDSRFMKAAAPERDGTFTIRGLPPGDYFLAAVDRENEDRSDWHDPAFLRVTERRAVRTRLAEGQKLSVDLKMIER